MPQKEYDPSKPLSNQMHESMAQCLAAGDHWKEAMKKSGYKIWYENLQNLRKRPQWVARLEWLKAQIADRVIEKAADHQAVTREEVVEGLRRIVRMGLEKDKHGRRDLSSAQRAYQDLGKSIGIFTERKIVETEIGDFENMSEQEVEDAILGLLGQLDPNKVRNIFGRAGKPGADGEVSPLATEEPDQDVSALSEAEDVSPTRH